MGKIWSGPSKDMSAQIWHALGKLTRKNVPKQLKQFKNVAYKPTVYKTSLCYYNPFYHHLSWGLILAGVSQTYSLNGISPLNSMLLSSVSGRGN